VATKSKCFKVTVTSGTERLRENFQVIKMTYHVSISESLYRQLKNRAQLSRRTVDEWVEETVKRKMQPPVDVEDDLPPWLQAELHAMQDLSDAALWALAQSTLSEANQNELSHLNETAQERPLTATEQSRQQTLLNEYNETVLRRAHAASGAGL
jgi:hypothetical protein